MPWKIFLVFSFSVFFSLFLDNKPGDRGLTNYGRLEIDEHGTGNVLASSGLAEEGVEGVVTTSDGLVGGHLAVGLDAVLQAVQLPAGIAHLDTGLTNMDRNTLTLNREKMIGEITKILFNGIGIHCVQLTESELHCPIKCFKI